MHRLLAVTIRAIAALVVCASLAQAAPGELSLQPGSKLWLTGTSTVHDYKSQATKLDVTFTCDPALWPTAATGSDAIEGLIRAKGVSAIDVVVGVTGLRSGKDGLDKNMYKALLAEKHPEIRFKLVAYEFGAAHDTAGTAIDARGTLTVAGVDREIAIPATLRREGDTLRLRGSVPLLMTQFGIKPPKMMLGTIKTSDKVVVHVDLVIGAADPARAATGTE